jgi:CxxC motif-containing protein
MSDKKEITCIVCPIGCKIVVKTDGKHFEVCNGNKCAKGIEYARAEALDPKRMLTSSILVKNGKWPLVSVRSSKPVPKNKLFEILKQIKKANVDAPIKPGQTIIKNVSNTNIDIIATKSVKKIENKDFPSDF